MTTAVATADEAAAVSPRQQQITLAGAVLVTTVVAIEALAVATAMPTVAHALHGLRYFGWSFTAFLLADIIGMVDAGSRVDRTGPTTSLVGGLLMFAAGLVVDGAAPDMATFLAGRVLQGLGGGALIVALNVLIARVFPEVRRPRVFAVLSAAWVVPALVGPTIAGAVTDTLGWRWVFFGIAPFAAIGAALLVPVLRSAHGGSAEALRRVGTSGGIMLAVGLGLLQSAGQRLDLWSMLLAAIGLVCLLMPLRRVLPGQSLRIGPGLPTVVALRGLFSFAFFGAEAYVPLTLTRIHHGSPTNVGIPLTLGAIGWAAAAWWQGRPGNAEHPLRLLRGGYVLVGAGVAGLVAVTWSSVSMWFAAPLWAVSGAGMGLAYPTISVLLLRLSPIDEQGANSAALQVCDVVGSIVGVAVTATIVALAGAGEFATAMRVADPLLAALTVAGLLLARRATHGAAIAR